MDRRETPPRTDRRTRFGPADDFVLPSRRAALEALEASLEAEAGPVLVSGEPGVGKSWICRKLRTTSRPDWQWACVALSPAIGPLELYSLILHAIGLPGERDIASALSALGDALEESIADGLRWGLFVEEAHIGPDSSLEELRVLAGRAELTATFAGIVLIGQNALLRRLASRSLSSLEARIAARVHVRALAIDEFRAYLDQIEEREAWDEEKVELIHRATAGNPRRALLGLLASRGYRSSLSKSAEPKPSEVPDRSWDVPVITPPKPPLALGEGMIEVGWDPDHDLDAPSEETEENPSGSFTPSGSRPDSSIEEPIDDRYAALQAAAERARYADRASSKDPTPHRDHDRTDLVESDVPPSSPSVWADGEQGFKPYSQLFSRLRQTRESQ